MEETTITIRHVEQKLDDKVLKISEKRGGITKNFIYVQILELGLKAYEKGYRVEDNIPIKERG